MQPVKVRPVRAPKAATLVTDELRQRIIRGDFAPGELLPPEPELAGQLGVSRLTVREAMAVLQSESLVAVRQGAGGGTRVLGPDVGGAGRYTGQLLQALRVTIEDVYEARLTIEPAAVRRLTAQATAADIEALSAIIAEQGTSDDPALSRRTACRFLDEIFKRAGNVTLWVLARQLNDIILMHAASAAEAAPEMTARWTRSGRRSRARLVELIAAGDADATERYWRRHLVAGSRELPAAGRGQIVEVVNRRLDP